ncbi:YggT family protein, partial [Acinetobacter baumannii]|nr:YggT family protein [Acinetobacter baumannii]
MGANSALIFGILINVAILLVFFRFLMQLAAVSPYNPVVLSTVKATKIVDIFGRIFPTVAKGRFNLAALVLLIILYLLKIIGVMYLTGCMPHSPVHVVSVTYVTMILYVI